MARDYAHKSREPERSRIPTWVYMFTTIVAISFVAFLYYLTQVPEDEGGAQAVRDQLTTALSEAETLKPAQAPKPVEEHETIEDLKDKADAIKQAFEFYELLENAEVPINLPGDKPATSATSTASDSTTIIKPVVPDAKSWVIQVASFSRVEDADKVRAQLILNGLPNTEIVSVDVPEKGTFHRVMVGPFSHRPTLNKAQDVLAELNFQYLVKTQ